MKHFSVYCVVFLAIFIILINGAVVVNRSEKGSTKIRLTESSTLKAKTAEPFKAKGLTRRRKCCNLGREVAKIGETCDYSSNVDHVFPDKHYHQMKTAVWTRRSHPIKRRLLAKCKPFKVFYEKCCRLEYYQIEDDLVKAKKKIKQYLKEVVRKNEVEEDQGSSNGEGGLPVEDGISYNGHKIE